MSFLFSLFNHHYWTLVGRKERFLGTVRLIQALPHTKWQKKPDFSISDPASMETVNHWITNQLLFASSYTFILLILLPRTTVPCTMLKYLHGSRAQKKVHDRVDAKIVRGFHRQSWWTSFHCLVLPLLVIDSLGPIIGFNYAVLWCYSLLTWTVRRVLSNFPLGTIHRENKQSNEKIK